MADTALWAAAIAGSAAIAGGLVSTFADGLKEKRRISHDLAVRSAERISAAADRRRTFEIENLLAAYDGLWLLARDMTKVHLADIDAARTTEHGYGGTRIPDGVEGDPAALGQAAKTLRLILDDDVRRLVQHAHSALGDVNMLGVKAKMFDRGPVSEQEGNHAAAAAASAVDTAMNAISERIRLLMAER